MERCIIRNTSQGHTSVSGVYIVYSNIPRLLAGSFSFVHLHNLLDHVIFVQNSIKYFASCHYFCCLHLPYILSREIQDHETSVSSILYRCDTQEPFLHCLSHFRIFQCVFWTTTDKSFKWQILEAFLVDRLCYMPTLKLHYVMHVAKLQYFFKSAN